MLLPLIHCPNCGTPLRILNTAGIATCRHCAARLIVSREPSRQGFAQLNLSTHLLLTLGGSPEIEVEDADPKILRRRLAHLDREWERISKQYSYSVIRTESLWSPIWKSRKPKGWVAWGEGYAWTKIYGPDQLLYMTMLWGLVAVIGVLLLFFPTTLLFGLITILLSCLGWAPFQIYRAYASAKREYLRRRTAILRRLYEVT